MESGIYSIMQFKSVFAPYNNVYLYYMLRGKEGKWVEDYLLHYFSLSERIYNIIMKNVKKNGVLVMSIQPLSMLSRLSSQGIFMEENKDVNDIVQRMVCKVIGVGAEKYASALDVIADELFRRGRFLAVNGLVFGFNEKDLFEFKDCYMARTDGARWSIFGNGA